MRVPYTIAALSLLLGCRDDTLPPLGQVLVYLDTDAPVRVTSSLREPAPLFDRVLVEIFPPGSVTPCAECRRELALDADKLEAKSFSFGFIPPARVLGYRMRVVLFRGAGLPARRESSIELVGFLPAVREEGITEITATLRVQDVGTVRGTLEAPILFDSGAPAVSAAGTWPGAAVKPCTGASPPGAVCVPGGAFFMGDPRVTVVGPLAGGRRERLAVVSPFHLDAHEVTVGELRASKLAVADSRGRVTDPVDDSADEIGGQCDYTAAPGANEELPVVCVSAALAQRFCAARGGDLPTEAELEVVASQRGTTLLPWGSRDPTCSEAAVARSSGANDGGAGGASCSDAGPLTLGIRTLPARPGSGTLDRVVLEGGTIVDLGANVSERTRDAFQPDDGACWSAALVFDPRCDDDTAKYRSAKGGNLVDVPVELAQARSAVGSTYQPPTLGFRCAYRGAK
jgi:formylglycine-generating enzyme required for sulfatase activity